MLHLLRLTAVSILRIVVWERSRLDQVERFRHQTRKWIAASVRHAAATMDQMIVTQLMLPCSAGWAPEMEECGVPSTTDHEGEPSTLRGEWYVRKPWAVKRTVVLSGSAP